LDDPDRTFASSDFVRLEVLPKPLYFGRHAEASFYQEFFDRISVWVPASRSLVQGAFDEARKSGLSAMDGLHVAAAVLAEAEELVTGEKPTSPLSKTKSVPVKSIRPVVS